MKQKLLKLSQKYFNVVSTQANLTDLRPLKLLNEVGRSLADIISEMSNTLDKVCQVNFEVKPSRYPFPTVVSPRQLTDKKDIILPDLLTTDAKLYTFTGIHSIDLLDGLVDCVSDLVVDTPTNKKILSLRDRLILTMAKIKLNVNFTAIAVLFNISRQTCSNYFKDTIPILSRVLKVMIPWPDQEIVRKNLPLSFKKYESTRIILDCAETVIEKCKCLKCRVLTYSQYKKNHTVKFDVGITPSGLIIEISYAFGGRASDKFIVNKTGVLDKLDFYDGVMVDKGFRIEVECLQRNLRLIRPPFLSQKQQMNRTDALSTADIARARVHVERVIQRLREFELLKGPVPWPLAHYFDDILIIAAGLTNLGAPIINIDKFM
ncbi:PREDICTED: uncharacterized protein LOC105555805 [Vollenhovia emeryi]|uniref:uncharacterized protein LOC105555805 n=1 Tax=Vollenhovia emeryi TaxID=411798 RepID=UPI0005F54F48|nr:PREDICTED: uncharacterized protein LOC105555805 [Vollenhovia emeryi]